MLLSDIYLWLAYSRVGTRKLNKLLERVSPNDLWNAFDSESRYNLDDKAFSALKRSRSTDYLNRIKEYLKINNIEYVTRADPLFPTALTQSEVDPPFALFYRGNLDIARNPCIAVVGTRHATQYGKYVTSTIVGELSEKFTVVSGLATGIDGYAHAAALAGGGNTVAVLGSGLFNPSPASNLKLFDEICDKGAVVSEYPPDVHATEYTFPQRNRIISGLSRGVLVVEAASKSGSLITANCALEQGRDVFAVPGDIDKLRSVGTNNLIKQGALAVTCAQDIFDFYGLGKSDTQPNRSFSLDFNENKILEMLESGEMSLDSLVTGSALGVAEVNTALSSLILYGLVRQKAKNIYCKL